MSKIDSLRAEIEFLKDQQPDEHIKDEIALLETELTGSFFSLSWKMFHMNGLVEQKNENDFRYGIWGFYATHANGWYLKE